MLILEKPAKKLYVNDYVFSAELDKEGDVRCTTAQVLNKRIFENTVSLTVLDTMKKDAEEVFMTLPADQTVMYVLSHGFSLFIWFLIGTIVSSLIWSFLVFSHIV